RGAPVQPGRLLCRLGRAQLHDACLSRPARGDRARHPVRLPEFRRCAAGAARPRIPQLHPDDQRTGRLVVPVFRGLRGPGDRARLVPFLLELIACALLCCVIPNCAVRWRDGLAGAAVAAIAIEILKIGFAIYIGSMSSYQTVYGALAAIPIFLLWMYVSWMAVLLGAVVAANLPTWRVDERLAHLSTG